MRWEGVLSSVLSFVSEIFQCAVTSNPSLKLTRGGRATKEIPVVFMNGKQVRIKRPPTVDGIPVDQFIEENAEPIWLHQNELWELMPVEDSIFEPDSATESDTTEDQNGIPF